MNAFKVGDQTVLGTIARIYSIRNTVLFEVRNGKGKVHFNVRQEDFE